MARSLELVSNTEFLGESTSTLTIRKQYGIALLLQVYMSGLIRRLVKNVRNGLYN